MPVAFRSLENNLRHIFPKYYIDFVREDKRACLFPKSPDHNIENEKENRGTRRGIRGSPTGKFISFFSAQTGTPQEAPQFPGQLPKFLPGEGTSAFSMGWGYR